MNRAQRAALVAEAHTWIGTPYHHAARIKGVGVDCGQILIGVYAGAGLVEAFDTGPYAREWHFHHKAELYLAWLQKYMRQVDAPKPGDVAMFRFGHTVSHGAIVVEWPRVIHSYVRTGCVLASADDAELKGRVHSFWTLKGRR